MRAGLPICVSPRAKRDLFLFLAFLVFFGFADYPGIPDGRGKEKIVQEKSNDPDHQLE